MSNNNETNSKAEALGHAESAIEDIYNHHSGGNDEMPSTAMVSIDAETGKTIVHYISGDYAEVLKAITNGATKGFEAA